MKNFYKNSWQKLLKKDYFPSYLKDVQSFDFKDFKRIILDANDRSEKLLNDVFKGDSLIIKNVFF